MKRQAAVALADVATTLLVAGVGFALFGQSLWVVVVAICAGTAARVAIGDELIKREERVS